MDRLAVVCTCALLCHYSEGVCQDQSGPPVAQTPVAGTVTTATLVPEIESAELLFRLEAEEVYSIRATALVPPGWTKVRLVESSSQSTTRTLNLVGLPPPEPVEGKLRPFVAIEKIEGKSEAAIVKYAKGQEIIDLRYPHDVLPRRNSDNAVLAEDKENGTHVVVAELSDGKVPGTCHVIPVDGLNEKLAELPRHKKVFGPAPLQACETYSMWNCYEFSHR